MFVDTSALLAGLNSPSGAAGAMLAALFADKQLFKIILSNQVIEEAERNIRLKFPLLTDAWLSFMLHAPLVAPDATIAEIRTAFEVIGTDDAPILASAIKACADVLVTWNTRDFMKEKVLQANPFPILTPGNFLKQFVRKT
ncbi:MAG: type II toxin-antitoxin system VapC family toxin [bacterium]|nr:type II toxin-antitoxin system VapC family toxin [bacterium]MDZ4284486.1 type II toxin-antitoxin system VapC family toxin [Patescibacteria group bacterium]